MPSDQRNLITAKATGLIFSLFSPRGAFWLTTVHAMHSSGTYQCPPFVFHSSLLTVKSVNLMVACDGFFA